ncbi:MAG TPA: hypothetical protein VK625_16585 [Flavitalea sp.]|nr:hypothetical protein [Flavitalea sp.]
MLGNNLKISLRMTNPYEVVLTNSMALKYFGKTDVVGESISISAFDQPLKVAGLVAAAIGQKINLWGSQRVIVGVVKNSHQSSPKSPYLPIFFFHREGKNKLASIRIANGDVQKSVKVIKDTYSFVLFWQRF